MQDTKITMIQRNKGILSSSSRKCKQFLVQKMFKLNISQKSVTVKIDRALVPKQSNDLCTIVKKVISQ